MSRQILRRIGLVVVALGVAGFLFPLPAYAGGGSGGGGNVETIRVNHCEYAAVAPGYVELLVSASDSISGVALYAYLPNGQLLGQVFAGGQYGGSVFLTGFVPDSITIISSTGAHVTVPCDPFQP